MGLRKIIDVGYLRLAVVIHDLVMTALAWWGAKELRYVLDTSLQVGLSYAHLEFPLVLIAQTLLFAWTGLYRGIWRFASLPDLWNILRAAVLGSFAIYLSLFLYDRLYGVPRSVLILYPCLLTVCLGLPRIAYRLWKDNWRRTLFSRKSGQRVLILGAENAGATLLGDLLRDKHYKVVGFVDENPNLRGTRIKGYPVLGTLKQLSRVARASNARMLLITHTSSSSSKIREMVQGCEQTGLPYRIVPRLEDVVAGRAHVNQVREVAIEDLLGRNAVELDWAAIREILTGHRVLVTGGGGSIGSALCRQVARLAAHSLTIVDNCEFNLYQITRELSGAYPDMVLNGVLADCGDEVAMARLFHDFKPHIVFHAAAYKHVPLLQAQLRTAFRNNVLATRTVADLSDRHDVECFVLISTDKAVNPTSVMGACKRIAEIWCQGLGAHSTTRFITVRFGNVLDSAGSVVPLFREQIRQGGPVTVTHPDISRYFMSIPEASQLILQAAALGHGGEIFALDMGESIKIRDLARQMIQLSGKKPDVDIAIVYVGLRPGEKLFEELFHPQEHYTITEHAQIFRAHHRPLSWNKVQTQIVTASEAVVQCDEKALQRHLSDILPSFNWNGGAQANNVVSIHPHSKETG